MGVHPYSPRVLTCALDAIPEKSFLAFTLKHAPTLNLLPENTLGIKMAGGYVATIPHYSIADRGGS